MPIALFLHPVIIENMGDTLKDYLRTQGYVYTKLTLTKTNHFEIKACINGVKGLFILDTGASNSCVDFETAQKFNLRKVKDSEILAAGAGAINMTTQVSKKNKFKIGQLKIDQIALVLFDLSHVNTALTRHKSKAVDGIIGADILKKLNAIIDYKKKHLFLKAF